MLQKTYTSHVINNFNIKLQGPNLIMLVESVVWKGKGQRRKRWPAGEEADERGEELQCR
jgi:hypothetical protein